MRVGIPTEYTLYRVQSTAYRVQSTEYIVQSTEYRTEYRVGIPTEFRVQSSESLARSSTCTAVPVPVLYIVFTINILHAN